MKDKIYKRAVTFMCVLIAISVIYGGIRSVNVYRNTVIDEYHFGGANAAADGIFSAGYNLLTVAERYIADETVATELRDVLGNSENQSLVSEKNAVEAVLLKGHALYNRLGEIKMEEADEAYRVKLFYNMKSYYSILCKNEYNIAAAKYNSDMRKIPARLFFGMSQKAYLPLFSAEDVVLED